jgi:hypothetical protein
VWVKKGEALFVCLFGCFRFVSQQEDP